MIAKADFLLYHIHHEQRQRRENMPIRSVCIDVSLLAVVRRGISVSCIARTTGGAPTFDEEASAIVSEKRGGVGAGGGDGGS